MQENINSDCLKVEKEKLNMMFFLLAFDILFVFQLEISMLALFGPLFSFYFLRFLKNFIRVIQACCKKHSNPIEV